MEFVFPSITWSKPAFENPNVSLPNPSLTVHRAPTSAGGPAAEGESCELTGAPGAALSQAQQRGARLSPFKEQAHI